MKKFISEAKPHTIKKFEIITNYVDNWARKILGYSKSEGLYYIDCMSNCGYYYDVNGISIEGTAVRVAKTLNQLAENYPNKTIDVFFNDNDKDKIDYLESQLELMRLDKINVHYSVKDCSVFLSNFDLRSIRNRNILLIYDPYQAIIDWDSLSPFLNSWGEVIINHMVMDTSRGSKVVKNPEKIKKYEKTYRLPIADINRWENDKEKLDGKVQEIIKSEVKNNPRSHYIASFPFYSRTNGLIYNLLFCTSNIEGFKLYKKTAWDAFGGRSSQKNTHGQETQLSFFADEDTEYGVITDEHCYNVSDIAKYINKKYSSRGQVELREVFNDIDYHPIFPSDGYKREIISELKELFNVIIEGRGKDRKIVFGDQYGKK